MVKRQVGDEEAFGSKSEMDKLTAALDLNYSPDYSRKGDFPIGTTRIIITLDQIIRVVLGDDSMDEKDLAGRKGEGNHLTKSRGFIFERSQGDEIPIPDERRHGMTSGTKAKGKPTPEHSLHQICQLGGS